MSQPFSGDQEPQESKPNGVEAAYQEILLANNLGPANMPSLLEPLADELPQDVVLDHRALLRLDMAYARLLRAPYGSGANDLSAPYVIDERAAALNRRIADKATVQSAALPERADYLGPVTVVLTPEERVYLQTVLARRSRVAAALLRMYRWFEDIGVPPAPTAGGTPYEPEGDVPAEYLQTYLLTKRDAFGVDRIAQVYAAGGVPHGMDPDVSLPDRWLHSEWYTRFADTIRELDRQREGTHTVNLTPKEAAAIDYARSVVPVHTIVANAIAKLLRRSRAR